MLEIFGPEMGDLGALGVPRKSILLQLALLPVVYGKGDDR